MRRSLRCLWVLPAAVLIACCQAPAPKPACAPYVDITPPDPGVGAAFELRFIHDDATARAIFQCAGTTRAADVDGAGAFDASLKGNGLVIEAQRSAFVIFSLIRPHGVNFSNLHPPSLVILKK